MNKEQRESLAQKLARERNWMLGRVKSVEVQLRDLCDTFGISFPKGQFELMRNRIDENWRYEKIIRGIDPGLTEEKKDD